MFSDYVENICFVLHVVDEIISKTVINEIMVLYGFIKALWENTEMVSEKPT